MSISIVPRYHALAAPAARPAAIPLDWPIGTDTAHLQDFVATADFLLEAVGAGLGGGDHDELLLDGLAAVLALEGRESALPAIGLLNNDDLRGVLARQAAEISKTILDTARRTARQRPGRQAEKLAHYDLRSPCKGHVWTHGVAELLMGPSGGPRGMQLYNEWQHQLVLLRDALLPFANWRTLPLPVGTVEGGLSATEATREKLLGALLMGRPEHAILVAQARALFGRAPAADSYAFQLADAVLLPAFLDETEDRFLLKHHPIVIDGAEGATDFVYSDTDYYAAPREMISGGHQEAPAAARADSAELKAAPIGGGRALLSLDLDIGGRRHSIDVGRIFRGFRFASGPKGGSSDNRASEPVTWHNAEELLGSALSTADSGIFAVPADAATTLALAGAIYPENVVIARGETLAELRLRGKGFGPLFIIGDIAR